MEKPTPYLVQNNINPYKPKENYPQKTNFAFVCSLLIYILIFYVFNLSPSKLFDINSRLVWFFLSNTLIIIILVDYGSFSSYSKSTVRQNDIYHEYTMRRYYDRKLQILRRNHSDGIRSSSIPEEEVPEFHDHKKRTSHLNDNERRKEKLGSISKGNNSVKVKAMPYRRSKSDGVKRVVFDESKNIVRMVEKIAYESPTVDDGDEENNKYANLSNEELNRRVEDFIQRFNRQIRLQRDV